MTPRCRIVLASRSPRRRELLGHIVPPEQIEVLPPSSSEEVGFEGLHQRSLIEERLRLIAATKCDDVTRQLGAERDRCCVVSADTVVVVGDGDGKYCVLGQPPDSNWRETTRHWFLDHYAGRGHIAMTGLCVISPFGRREKIVSTHVAFRSDVAKHLDWYLSTGEPIGKAGGYAIQGAASIFIERIEGSLTNVVGLPLRELLDVLKELDILATKDDRHDMLP